MARRKRKIDEGPTGPGEWIVTFSDCMTLLLCFFVLLLTFSSFDEVELQKLAGAFSGAVSHDSIFPIPREIKESSVPPPERTMDVTEKGSETPTQSDKKAVKFPARLPPILDDDVYKDRKVLYIPSEWVFFGKGSVLTREGREYLKMIGRLLRMVPSRVVIAESGPAAEGHPAGQTRLDRAWAVMRYLTEHLRLPKGRFNVTASQPSTPARLRGHRVVAVTIITGNVY
ncbi:MAG TPA: flagellar motor protein MotB [Phycisphaerae bacterium]|nr:flagellar motor protein MotB [Phycisphaerae bacterium]